MPKPVRDSCDFTSLATGVHVWSIALSSGPSPVQLLFDLLSSDETRRAEAYRFERDRESFVVARGLLRMLLSRYTSLYPKEIRFDYGITGKPLLRLDYRIELPPLRFSVSHCDDLVMYAIARECEVGIDVERIIPVPHFCEVAKQFFSATECGDLASVHPQKQLEAFFNCWTRKEAYVKGLGGGLSIPLNSFTVSLLPDSPAEFRSTNTEELQTSGWMLCDLHPSSRHVAALVYERPCRNLRVYQFRNAREAVEALASEELAP
jgi:4'-phosphopantetheinyl transferase